MPGRTKRMIHPARMRRPASHSDSERGMTLVELVTVLAIIGLAAAVALPTLQRSITKSRAQREMRGVLSLFDTARSEAMRLQVPVRVQLAGNEVSVLDANNNLIRRHPFSDFFIVGDTPASVPDISDYPATSVFLYGSDGSLQGNQGGGLYFADRRRNFFRLATTKFTGRPRAEMWTGGAFSPRRKDWLWK